MPPFAVDCTDLEGGRKIRRRAPRLRTEDLMEKHDSPLERDRIEEPADRLDSWKEIAAYLNRDVTTARR